MTNPRRAVLPLITSCLVAVAGCTVGAAPSPRPANPSTPAAAALAHGTLRPRVGDGGDVTQQAIPGTSDRFAARPAMVWTPPILRTRPTLRLPVLVMLHGTPGSPTDWLERGAIRTTLDAFAAGHGGRGPVVVMPDINGQRRADTECIHTPSGGDVHRYLQDTVRTWIPHHLPATADPRHWAVGGLSEGGTCAALLALTRPARYRAFADFSGLADLTLGRDESTALARRALFAGSGPSYDRSDPRWLAAHGPFGGLSGWFESGTRDVSCLRDAVAISALADSAGMESHLASLPGGHEWAVWTRAFAQALPWLWSRIQ